MFSSDDSHPRGAEPEFEKKEVYYMPNVKNQETLVKIKEDLDGVSAMWVVDYRGLTVKEMQQLRRDIRETGSVLKVYKNTLVHLALSEAELRRSTTCSPAPARSCSPARRGRVG